MEMRDVEGFGNRYAVADDGRVYNKDTGNWLSGGLNDKGYRVVTLRQPDRRGHSRRFVHRLVCEAFHGPCPGSNYEVDHINAVHDDNRAENLRWVTREENRRYAVEMGLNKPDRPMVAFNRDGDVLRFASARDARRAGFSLQSFDEGLSHTCNGYVFVDEGLFDQVDIETYFAVLDAKRSANKIMSRAKRAKANMSCTNVGEIVEEVLSGIGLRKVDLGALLGWSKQQVNQYLNGKHSEFAVLSDVLGALGYKLAIVPESSMLPEGFYTVSRVPIGSFCEVQEEAGDE